MHHDGCQCGKRFLCILWPQSDADDLVGRVGKSQDIFFIVPFPSFITFRCEYSQAHIKFWYQKQREVEERGQRGPVLLVFFLLLFYFASTSWNFLAFKHNNYVMCWLWCTSVLPTTNVDLDHWPTRETPEIRLFSNFSLNQQIITIGVLLPVRP